MRAGMLACVALAAAALACVSVRTVPTTASFTAQEATTVSVRAALVFPPLNVVAPLVAGLPLPGGTLTTADGEWTSTAPVTYTYAWERCRTTAASSCTPIANAASRTYVPVTADAGFRLRSRVRATNSGGFADAHSLMTAEVP